MHQLACLKGVKDLRIGEVKVERVLDLQEFVDLGRFMDSKEFLDWLTLRVFFSQCSQPMVLRIQKLILPRVHLAITYYNWGSGICTYRLINTKRFLL